MNRTDIDAGRREAGLELVSEQIVADAPDHIALDGFRANASHRTGLIRTLASGNHLEVSSERGLAGRREFVHAHHEVHVETA